MDRNAGFATVYVDPKVLLGMAEQHVAELDAAGADAAIVINLG